ncbi:MAG: hypothetical protein ACFE0I_24010 [Elainellaceae cyanobacterium]
MKAASRYWRLVKLNASGGRQIDELEDARAFFRQSIEAAAVSPPLSDGAIQRQLWQIVQEEKPGYCLAEQCLRCFISHQIDSTCRQLAAQFGNSHGFAANDLLLFVLDDDRPDRTGDRRTYVSLATEILQTFDPARAGLSTWVNRQVKHHRGLNQFLLQHGVYLVSDWAILNDTKPRQLQHILAEFHGLTDAEVQQASQLLQAYHQVYRCDRLNQRLLGNVGRCASPTPEQLQRIVDTIYHTSKNSLSCETVMSNLQTLATYLRHYRIHVRGGTLPTESLDQPEFPIQAIAMPPSDDDDERQHEFLAHYRQQMLAGLDHALNQVLSDRLIILDRKRHVTPQDFLEALHAFHCLGRSMSDIAAMLGLKAQYQVTRLLKLKDFRADVRQRLLVYLRDRTRDLAESFADPVQLRILDNQLDELLSEQVDRLMQHAEAEASVAQHQPMTSLFARRLCHHLKVRRTAS